MNTEHASALTMFSLPAVRPPTYAPKPYAGRGRFFMNGGYSQKKGDPGPQSPSHPRPVMVRPP